MSGKQEINASLPISSGLSSLCIQFANSDQLQAVSAAVRFGGLGRRPRRIQ